MTRYMCNRCESVEVSGVSVICGRCFDEVTEESYAQTRDSLRRYEEEKAAGLWDEAEKRDGGGGNGWIVVVVIIVIVLLILNSD